MAQIGPGIVRDLLTLVLGIVSGVLSGAFGVGGAIISTPGLRALGAPPLLAVGSTLPPIVLSAAVGTARYSREGLVDWRLVAATAPAGIGAAILGALISHSIPGDGHWLMVATAALLALTAVRMVRKRPPRAKEGADEPARPVRQRPWVGIGVGVAAGLLSGLLGVGGGLVIVPGFSEIGGLSLKASIATSLACVGILAIPSTLTHAALGGVDWRLAILLSVAVLPGARLGAAASIRTGDRRLQMVVAAVLALTAVIYAVGEFGAL